MSFTAPLRDLNKLNTFVRVAQRQSFTKAAAELRTTPSVVSKRMKELEDSLGFSLLNRSSRLLNIATRRSGLRLTHGNLLRRRLLDRRHFESRRILRENRACCQDHQARACHSSSHFR